MANFDSEKESFLQKKNIYYKLTKIRSQFLFDMSDIKCAVSGETNDEKIIYLM